MQKFTGATAPSATTRAGATGAGATRAEPAAPSVPGAKRQGAVVVPVNELSDVVRLQQDFFHDLSRWPIALLIAGIALMLFASSYSAIKAAFRRRLQR